MCQKATLYQNIKVINQYMMVIFVWGEKGAISVKHLSLKQSQKNIKYPRK